MSRAALLALDLGTTSVRALAVDAEARVRARVSRPLTTRYPHPGWVEQDPEEMWTRSLEVLRECLAQAGLGARDLAGLGVVTQRSTAIAWDARTLRPLAPAQSWQDQRTAERVAGLRAAGIPLNTLASATKFEHWLRGDAELQRAAREGRLRLGTPDAWLTTRLSGGGLHVTDPGNASCTALFDPAGGAWAQGLLDLFAVPIDALPDVVATSAVLGESDADVLGAPVPLAARAGDQQAAAFAQGVHAAGDAKLTLGTSAMLDVHSGERVAEATKGAYPLALWQLADGARAFCVEGTVITAGSAVEWAVELGLARDAAELSRLAAGARPSRARFVPALQGLGTPLMDEAARGALFGLSRGDGPPELARAVLLGIAQRCVDVCEALVPIPGALRVDGGLAQSDPLLQALADLSGREVRRAREVETTALGAAFLAGLCTGVFASPRECAALVAGADAFAPRVAADERERERSLWHETLEHARTAKC